MKARRPNIVILNPDSYRGDVVGHLGNVGALTPHLDALIEEGGVSFANAFTQNPYCTPSRCSFMTGLYPHVMGHRSMKYMLRPHEPNLFSVLRREGYANWLIGKNDLFSVKTIEDYEKHGVSKLQAPEVDQPFHLPDPLPKGDPMRECFYGGVARRNSQGPIYKNSDENLIQGAVDAIMSSSTHQPFCLFVPISNPHPPYFVEDEYYDRIDPDRIPARLPIPQRTFHYLDEYRKLQRSSELDESDWTEIRRVYYAMCAKADAYLGRLVEALRQKGIYDDTLVVFFSDHGDFTGDYDMVEKSISSLNDKLISTPFCFKLPSDMDSKPGIRPQLTELVDLSATIYDLLDIEPGYSCQGRSLAGLLAGDESEIRDAVFAEGGSRRDERQFLNADCAKMSPDSFYGKRYRVLLEHDLVGSYCVSVRTHKHKYVYRPYMGKHALFDLEKDPGEMNNLSGTPEHRELEDSMCKRLLQYYAETADVLPFEQDERSV